jgi:hypothetical protein
MEGITEPPKKNGNGQLNLNTVLLSICMCLSGWVLFSINALDEKIAGMIPLINANSAAILDINNVDKDQTEKLERLSDRLTKLETLEENQLKLKH